MIHTLSDRYIDLSIFKIVGDTSVEEIIHAMGNCISQESWHNKQNIVIDQREMTNIIPFEKYGELLKYVKSTGLHPTVKHATLVSCQFRVAISEEWRKNAIHHLTPMNFRSFQNEKEASEWLDVDDKLLSHILKSF